MTSEISEVQASELLAEIRSLRVDVNTFFPSIIKRIDDLDAQVKSVTGQLQRAANAQ